MQTDWGSAVVAIAGMILSGFVAAITATWTIGSRMSTREEVADVKKHLSNKMDTDLRLTGESLQAIRQKIEQVEMWIRDRYAPREQVDKIATEIADRLNVEVAENRRRLDQLPAISVKVETLWSFVMDRGRLEAHDKGLMQRNSPLALTETGWAAVEPLLPDVASFCRSHPEYNSLDENELAAVLVANFEDRLIHEVCEPSHIYLGACIVLLVEALKATKVIARGRPEPGTTQSL